MEQEPRAAGGLDCQPEREPLARIRDLVKTFTRSGGSVVPAIDGVSLDVYPGEFLVLLGPSGCGKTTLLRTLAGLEQPDSGTIEIRGEAAFSAARRINVPPERRRLSMIFQSYALWPHMTAFDNVAYPLRNRPGRKLSRHDIAERVRRALDMTGVPELAGQYPNQMSGGQQQRIALARALVGSDDLILFDEPLSNVDAKVREQLRLELLSMQQELGFAAVYVTHDQAEAMQLGHRIAVLDRGRVAQLGSPSEVYGQPLSRYVANFVGTTNEILGTVESLSAPPDPTASVDTKLGTVLATVGHRGISVGDEVAALCRPERCQVSVAEPGAGNKWRAEVVASLFLGAHTEHLLRVDGHTFRCWAANSRQLEPGTPVWLSVAPEDVRLLPAHD